MSYNKTTWETGDVVTSEKLNNIEDGIENIDNNNIELIKISMSSSSSAKLDRTLEELVEIIESGKIYLCILNGALITFRTDSTTVTGTGSILQSNGSSITIVMVQLYGLKSNPSTEYLSVTSTSKTIS